MTLFCSFEKPTEPIWLSREILNKYKDSTLYKMSIDNMNYEKYNGAIILEDVLYETLKILGRLLYSDFDISSLSDYCTCERHNGILLSMMINGEYVNFNYPQFLPHGEDYKFLNEYLSLKYLAFFTNLFNIMEKYNIFIIETIELFESLNSTYINKNELKYDVGKNKIAKMIKIKNNCLKNTWVELCENIYLLKP